jgi:hypothetical protein
MLIESEPSGALVTLNDVEVGRTPVRVGFTYYGVYDVRLELEGYEPLRTAASAKTPVHEFMPLDFFSMMVPADIDTEVYWKFNLEPAKERTGDPEVFERELIERAREMGAREAGK